MELVQFPGGDSYLVGKNRNPFAVIFFSIVTLGIYWLYWYYRINDEMRQHEPLVRCSPGWAAFSQLVPVAGFISHYNTATRIQRMELADEVPNTISPLVTIVLLFFFAVGYVFQVQSHLNAHWDSHRFALARAQRQGFVLAPTPRSALPGSQGTPGTAPPIASDQATQ